MNYAGMRFMPEQLARDGKAHVGFGQAELAVPAATSPWAVAVVTSVVGAAAGWALEEVSRTIRRKRRR